METLYPEEGKAAYRIAADEYYLPPLDLTEDELVAMNLAVAAVHVEGGRGREALWSFGDAPADAVPALAALPVIDALPRCSMVAGAAPRCRSPIAASRERWSRGASSSATATGTSPVATSTATRSGCSALIASKAL